MYQFLSLFLLIFLCLRYESHKDFLTHYIAEKIIPKGLQLELESTIRTFDQEFVGEWYSKRRMVLQGFYLILMKDITTYCEKTIKSTNESIKNTETTLRNSTEKQEFVNIDKILKTDVEATKHQLQQGRFKKFNYLKYKENPTNK